LKKDEVAWYSVFINENMAKITSKVLNLDERKLYEA